MKLTANKKDEEPVGKIYFNQDAPQMDLDLRGYLILSILGGLSLVGIWLISTFLTT